MIKQLIAITTLIFASISSAMTCQDALPTNMDGFCASFKSVAQCYCTSAGLPLGMCQDMKQIYRRMVATYGSLQSACNFQHHTSSSECIDDWNCYLQGGTNSKQQLCNHSGLACE